MIKLSLRIFIGLAGLVLLAACSSLAIPGLATSQPTAEPTSATVENQLGVGMIRLEGSDLAITAEQAVELLPVWKAVRVMSADKAASAIEIAALYQQTLGILNAEQVQAIQGMSWAQAELNNLMQDLGVQANPRASTASSAAKSLQSSTASSAAGGGPGGDFGGPGGFGGGDALGSQINAVSSNQAQTAASSASSSSGAASPASSAAAGQPNLNALFADSVVSLLQQRAGL